MLMPTDHSPHAGGHSAPLQVLNETAILNAHGPDPLSYLSRDFLSDPAAHAPWPSLIILHIFATLVAFFVLLPMAISLRSSAHAWHPLAAVAFNLCLMLGVLAASLYSRVTPNLYEGSSHSRSGYLILFVVFLISLMDVINGFRRIAHFLRDSKQKFALASLWQAFSRKQGLELHGQEEEYAELMQSHGGQIMEDAKRHRHARFASASSTITTRESLDHEEWEHGSAVQSLSSDQSDLTLLESVISSPRASVRHHVRRLALGLFHVAEHALVILAFVQTLSGVVVYTGGCRASYLPICLAHLIKGGIFWFFGLVTFARYLGAWARLGWAWNKRPTSASRLPSAEMVESFVIFFYGITNTWMERFGVDHSSKYTTKQVQHISINVMFWFAGLIGIAIESRRARTWLAAPVAVAVATDPMEDPEARESTRRAGGYTSSFNPFPALVIGVTGLAMSAHHQEYVFQVQIHALWGALLAAAAGLRWATYFLLWVRAPGSVGVLPSRPPTEALAGFFLTCGGLVFALSTEQISYAAMRMGHDDVMMFMNVAVAITCFACSWVLATLAFNGWVQSHSPRLRLLGHNHRPRREVMFDMQEHDEGRR